MLMCAINVKEKLFLSTRKQRGNITAVWRCQQRECRAMRSVERREKTE